MSDRDDKKPAPLPKPTDWEEMFPGRFLKAPEFKGRKVTLTIADIDSEVLETDKGPKLKGIVSFKETDKQWAINRTNATCVVAMFGRKVPEWKGHKVTLFPGEWRGEPAIRVWGSPEIAADFEVTIKLARKNPIKMTMHKVPS